MRFVTKSITECMQKFEELKIPSQLVESDSLTISQFRARLRIDIKRD